MPHRALGAPWRMAYIGAPKSGGCIFCAAPADDRKAALVLAASEHVVVMLNRYPYANGHLMVAPRRPERDAAAVDRAAAGDLPSRRPERRPQPRRRRRRRLRRPPALARGAA